MGIEVRGTVVGGMLSVSVPLPDGTMVGGDLRVEPRRKTIHDMSPAEFHAWLDEISNGGCDIEEPPDLPLAPLDPFRDDA